MGEVLGADVEALEQIFKRLSNASQRRVRRAVRRTVPWYRRLTWPVDPNPLLRR